VIADWKVARRYLQIMDDLGVECGLAKSVLSHKGQGLEFAKSTFIDGQNVSPISFKELQTSINELTNWASFARKFNLNFDRQARVLGFGYKARRKGFNKMNHALQAVHLTNIVKADLKTDILTLRRGAPKNFNKEYLFLFTDQVLRPL